MISPFPANATLTFKVATGLTVDPKTGNHIPTTENFTLAAYLKSKGRVKADDIPGVSEGEEILEGYAVEPMILPPGIKHLAKAEALISASRGTFTLFLPTPSPFAPLIEQAAGTSLQGAFRRQA